MTASRDPDWEIRLAAFEALSALVATRGPVLAWADIDNGFEYRGGSFRFANQTKGIFRPAGMADGALSVKTTVPRSGARKYEDLAAGDSFLYAFQARGLDYHDNRILVRCSELSAPLIYFFGVKPGYYRPIWPVFIGGIDHERHSVVLLTSETETLTEPGMRAADPLAVQIARRYATVEVKKRLHQELFRHLVIAAYEERCAICRLPRRELLDASHIVPDRDTRGNPAVTNGLALCKLHHGAYDCDLIGIRPDRVIEISRALAETQDGPTLEMALKGFAGKVVHLPRRTSDHPDVELLELRYEQFRKAG